MKSMNIVTGMATRGESSERENGDDHYVRRQVVYG